MDTNENVEGSESNEEVWNTPDPVKVVALDIAAILCGKLGPNDPNTVAITIETARKFEIYLRSLPVYPPIRPITSDSDSLPPHDSTR